MSNLYTNIIVSCYKRDQILGIPEPAKLVDYVSNPYNEKTPKHTHLYPCMKLLYTLRLVGLKLNNTKQNTHSTKILGQNKLRTRTISPYENSSSKHTLEKLIFLLGKLREICILSGKKSDSLKVIS